MPEGTNTKPAHCHFGDPCIHCGIAHEDFVPGPCNGDFTKAKPIGYVSAGVRWDGVERYLVRYSDTSIREIYSHVSNHLPYYHFGHSDELITPPRYDERIRAEAKAGGYDA